jgi:Cold shock proteins
MQVPPEISFNGLDKSEYNEDYIRERIRRLERMHDAIIACRVVVERPHRNRHTGNPFRVRVELTLPRKRELVASKEENAEPNVQLRTVIARAFDAMERQLRAVTTEQAPRTTYMAPLEQDQPHGIVVRLFRNEGYGFIKTLDGREFYMHRNSVLHDDFDELRIGTEVRFTPELGDKGPQASTVQIIANPGANASDNPPDLAAPPEGWEIRP